MEGGTGHKHSRYYIFLLLSQNSLRELPKVCRIASFACLICQTTLHATGPGKVCAAWLQPAGAFPAGFILSWLSATNVSVFFFSIY